MHQEAERSNCYVWRIYLLIVSYECHAVSSNDESSKNTYKYIYTSTKHRHMIFVVFCRI